MKTLKNKIYALVLMGAGMIPVLIDRDCTFLILAACFAVPMFFAKKNWIH